MLCDGFADDLLAACTSADCNDRTSSVSGYVESGTCVCQQCMDGYYGTRCELPPPSALPSKLDLFGNGKKKNSRSYLGIGHARSAHHRRHQLQMLAVTFAALSLVMPAPRGAVSHRLISSGPLRTGSCATMLEAAQATPLHGFLADMSPMYKLYFLHRSHLTVFLHRSHLTVFVHPPTEAGASRRARPLGRR